MLKVTMYKTEEMFWSLCLSGYIKYSRVYRKIEKKWYFRKGESTDWRDVWGYLDYSKKTGERHSRRLNYLASKRDRSFIKQMDAKYR